MSDEKISQMPDAGTLSGAEIIPLVRSGNNFSTSARNIAALAPGGGGGGSGLLPTSSKTANYSVLAADTGIWFDNGGAPGAVVFTLPAPSPGLNYGFAVVSAHLLQVSASGGASIAYGPGNSAPGGNVNSAFPFSTILIYAPSGVSNQWVALSATGGWNVN